MSQPESKQSSFKSPWVWAILALFSVMFTVNFAFFTVGKDTAPGLVNEEYYKYGVQQNKIDKEYRQQVTRGWVTELVLPKQWHIKDTHNITLKITTKDGKPLTGGIAEVTAYRPSDSKFDVVLQLKEEEKGSGIYQTAISLPLQGVWDINVLFTLDDKKHKLNERVVIQGDGEAEPNTLEKIVQFISS